MDFDSANKEGYSGMLKMWFFNHYAYTPKNGPMPRHFYFAQQLKKYGIEATIFTANVLHYNGKIITIEQGLYAMDTEDNVPMVYVKTLSYSGNGISRIKNMLSFFVNLMRAAKQYVQINNSPDVIYASSPHLLTTVAGIIVARRLQVPCIVEVRDLWPEAIFAFGKAKKGSLLGKILQAGEKWIYKNAAAIVFTKEGDVDYIKEQGWESEIPLSKCHYVNNGVDIDVFQRSIKECILDDTDLCTDKFKVIYTGSVRSVNNIGKILDAAKLLTDSDIVIFIYGDGSELEKLRQRVVNEKLNNIVIKGFVEKKYIPYILSKADVTVLNYAQDKYNWSRGNSSNKLFEYMASGKPVISTVKMGYSIINRYHCGIELDDNTPEELAKAIMEFKNMPKDRYKIYCDNAIAGAKEFDFKKLSKRLYGILDNVIIE